MAEAVLKQKLKWAGVTGWRVTSAGLCAEEGAKMSENAKKALKQLGINVPAFRSKRVTAELMEKSDYIICMTSAQREAFFCMDKAFVVSQLTGEGESSDPYGGTLNDYIRCSHEIERACNIITNKIISGELK